MNPTTEVEASCDRNEDCTMFQSRRLTFWFENLKRYDSKDHGTDFVIVLNNRLPHHESRSNGTKSEMKKKLESYLILLSTKSRFFGNTFQLAVWFVSVIVNGRGSIFCKYEFN